MKSQSRCNHVQVLILVMIFSCSPVVAQETFNLQPVIPTEVSTTWVDFLSTVVNVHVTIPANVSATGIQPDQTQRAGYVLARKIKVVKRDTDDIPTLQVIYLPLSELSGFSLPANDANPVDLGKPLQGSVFEINCKDNSAVTIKDGTATPVSGQANFLKRECLELQRTMINKSFFGGMKIGDSKDFSAATKPSLISDDIIAFGINQWTFRLSNLSADPGVASFDVQGQLDSSGLGKSFQDCTGILSLDIKGVSTELNMKCLARKGSDKLPDNTVIESSGELTSVFKRRVF